MFSLSRVCACVCVRLDTHPHTHPHPHQGRALSVQLSTAYTSVMEGDARHFESACAADKVCVVVYWHPVDFDFWLCLLALV